jgi:ribosome-binding protein aMBF1 (putative translation factor)
MTERKKTMEIQFIQTPNGDRLAVIPEAEYNRMIAVIEDRQDREAVVEFNARKKAGEEEMIPAEFANRIIDGENKVRVWRDYRGLSARDLAEKAGISPSYLSQIEKGDRAGRFDTLKKIADALKIGVDDLA